MIIARRMNLQAAARFSALRLAVTGRCSIASALTLTNTAVLTATLRAELLSRTQAESFMGPRRAMAFPLAMVAAGQYLPFPWGWVHLCEPTPSRAERDQVSVF